MTTGKRKRIEKRLNDEAAGALAALKRARKRAEEIAARTGTDLIQVVDGKIVRVKPPREASRR
jgi:hypothetical protein